jgi:hypothetical protein
MPFEEITTPSIVHRGPPSRQEYVVVTMTTGSKLMFNTFRYRDGNKRFELISDSWTQPVRDVVARVSEELSRRGRPPELADFNVLLKLDDVLAIGRPINLTVIYGRSAHHEYDVRLRGTPVEFSIVRVSRQ